MGWYSLDGGGFLLAGIFLCADFFYKTWWKPRFPMDYRPLVKGHIANFGILLDICEFFGF